MNHKNRIKILNNHCFINFLVSFLIFLCLKHQINESSKITKKQCFYAIKNLWNLSDIFNLNINQLVINIICGSKSGSWDKKGGE